MHSLDTSLTIDNSLFTRLSIIFLKRADSANPDRDQRIFWNTWHIIDGSIAVAHASMRDPPSPSDQPPRIFVTDDISREFLFASDNIEYLCFGELTLTKMTYIFYNIIPAAADGHLIDSRSLVLKRISRLL